MQYSINKGVGRPLDFFGLKSYFILYFIVGMALAFIMFFIVRLIDEVIGYVVAGTIAIATYVVCYHLNNKYGVSGIGHKMAMGMCPERVSPRRSRKLVKRTRRII